MQWPFQTPLTLVPNYTYYTFHYVENRDLVSGWLYLEGTCELIPDEFTEAGIKKSLITSCEDAMTL